jgi:hypothetical protein
MCTWAASGRPSQGWAASPRVKQGRHPPWHGVAAPAKFPTTGGERGWGKWSRCMPTARGSNFGRWREEKLTVERAPRWWAGGRRGMGWRASSGGGDWLEARRGVQSTGGAHGGIGGAVPWPEVPVCMEALLDGNDNAGWLAIGSEQRTTVRGGVWRQWETHQLRGGLGRWLVEAVIDEVAGDGGGGLALRADTNKKQRCEGEEKQVDLASSMTSHRG